MSTHDYDPKRVSVTVGGVPIRSASVDIAAEIMADIKRSFDTLLSIDEMFLSDGRAHRRAPRDVCSWCCADRYDPATGRCPRCNEPWYDGVLAWPGPSTATLTPCALRFGGGSISPSDHLSVVNRMIMHRGLRSELAREIKWQRLCPTRTENI